MSLFASKFPVRYHSPNPPRPQVQKRPASPTSRFTHASTHVAGLGLVCVGLGMTPVFVDTLQMLCLSCTQCSEHFQQKIFILSAPKAVETVLPLHAYTLGNFASETRVHFRDTLNFTEEGDYWLVVNPESEFPCVLYVLNNPPNVYLRELGFREQLGTEYRIHPCVIRTHVHDARKTLP